MQITIFKVNMDAQFYVSEILSNGLLPFIRNNFPDGHRSQQDNDPKDTSRLARSFMKIMEYIGGRLPLNLQILIQLNCFGAN